MYAMTTHGSHPFADSSFTPGDWFVFGCEGSGLPEGIRNSFPEAQRIRLPMRPKEPQPQPEQCRCRHRL